MACVASSLCEVTFFFEATNAGRGAADRSQYRQVARFAAAAIAAYRQNHTRAPKAADSHAPAARNVALCSRICPLEIDKAVSYAYCVGFGGLGLDCNLVRAVCRPKRRLVDYYEASGVGLDHYAQVLHDKRIKYDWKYGEHNFPHDIVHRELSTGRSRVDALTALGIEANVVPESNVLDGINVVRKMLGRKSRKDPPTGVMPAAVA